MRDACKRHMSAALKCTGRETERQKHGYKDRATSSKGQRNVE
jgi:hypothetical protein